MNTTTHAQQQVEQYLDALGAHLRALPAAEREEILRELRAHIRDAAELHGTPSTLTLARLGPAADLAAQYAGTTLVRRAALSRSPVLLLRASLRLATRGLAGIVLFLLAITGYSTGMALLLTAVLKVFLPGKVGFWVHNGNLDGAGLQIAVPPSPAHEVLGGWYILVGAGAGLLAVVLTTLLLRRGLRWSQRVQQRLQPQLHAVAAL